MFKRKEPARENCVADLDRIISKSVSFKLHGKYHTIRPITSGAFFDFTHKMWQLDELANDKNATGADIKKKYLEVAQSVCSTITMEDVQDMTEAQFAGLFSVITDTITGRVNTEQTSVKKKTSLLKKFGLTLRS